MRQRQCWTFSNSPQSSPPLNVTYGANQQPFGLIRVRGLTSPRSKWSAGLAITLAKAPRSCASLAGHRHGH